MNLDQNQSYHSSALNLLCNPSRDFHVQLYLYHNPSYHSSILNLRCNLSHEFAHLCLHHNPNYLSSIHPDVMDGMRRCRSSSP